MLLFKNIQKHFDEQPSYLVLAALLNGAIVMNFHKLIYRNPILMCVLLFFLLVSIIDIKKWWATVINCLLCIIIQVNAFPRIGNHSSLLLITSLVISVLIMIKLSGFRFKINTNFISFLFRTFVVTIYFYTGFHKLNTDYFNTCVSCVNDINDYTLSNILNTPFKTTNGLSTFFQWSALIIECIVPFGILHHKSRKIAILILLCFHSYLSLSVFADFSATALFLLLGCAIDLNKKEISSKTIFYLKIYLIAILVAILSFSLLKLTSVNPFKNRFIQGVLFNIGFVLFAFHYIKTIDFPRFHFNRTYFAPLLVCSFLISIWTLKTYIGLGNAGNLTMFSNLVTEKSMSNHLLIDTNKTKLFDFEEDNVYIISLNNPYIKEDFNGYKLPVVEFRFLVNYWNRKYKTPMPCTLIYKGKKIVYSDIRNSPFKESKWWYKYLSFRKIQTTAPNRCRW